MIGAAGLAIEIARLRVEVRRQLAEVEESRARIVTAGYEERRRLERDLHDGAQQRLVSIGLALRHLQHQLPRRARRRRSTPSVAELARAIEELRELARGVRPAGLDDGLGRALRELAARSRLRTRVEATDERFEDRLETAAYFVASEALANAAKHARAAERRDRAPTRRNGSLVVLGARRRRRRRGRRRRAPGLAGITDRVAALGGSVSVASPPGRGDRRRRGAAVRVVIAEDQALLREGLERLFEDSGARGGRRGRRRRPAARRGQRARARPRRRRRADAADATPTRASAPRAGSATPIPDVGVLVLSQHVEAAGAVGLVSQGGFGYLLKDRVLDVADFLEAAERVARGGSALDPQVVVVARRRRRRRRARRC